jgi:hypothetical protein
MGERKLVNQSLVSVSFFNRVEIRTLEILDEGEREQSPIVDLANSCRDFFPTQSCCSSQPSFACNELKSLSTGGRPHSYWLQQTGCTQAGLKLFQLFGLKFPSRLKWIGGDLRDWNFLIVASLRADFCRPFGLGSLY